MTAHEFSTFVLIQTQMYKLMLADNQLSMVVYKSIVVGLCVESRS